MIAITFSVSRPGRRRASSCSRLTRAKVRLTSVDAEFRYVKLGSSKLLKPMVSPPKEVFRPDPPRAFRNREKYNPILAAASLVPLRALSIDLVSVGVLIFTSRRCIGTRGGGAETLINTPL